MKKRFISKLLMAALVVVTMGVFSSCKDYDDDINANTALINQLQTQVKTLEEAAAKAQADATKALQDADKAQKAADAAQQKANDAYAKGEQGIKDAAEAQRTANQALADAAAALAYAKQAEADILQKLDKKRTITFCKTIEQAEILGKYCIHSKNNNRRNRSC